MIKMYILMTLVTGGVAYDDRPGFSTQRACERAAEIFVDRRMGTGRYKKIEVHCALELEVVI